MAVFVELAEGDDNPPQDAPPTWRNRINHLRTVPSEEGSEDATGNGVANGAADTDRQRGEPQELAVRENPNQNRMTQALGCYP